MGNDAEFERRTAERFRTIACLIDEIAEWARHIADGNVLTKEARPYCTELDLEFTFQGAPVWQQIAVAWNPHSGRFEVSINSQNDFVIVVVEFPAYLGEVFDWVNALAERAVYENRKKGDGKDELL